MKSSTTSESDGQQRSTEPPQRFRLRWRIKSSFVRYVLSMSDGQCSATDGASADAELRFTFSPGRSHSATAGPHYTIGGDTLFDFRGDVRFAAHHGALYVRIADPRIESHDAATVLTANCADDETSLMRTVIALLTPSPESTGVEMRYEARLTAEGSSVFGGSYPEGMLVDELEIFADDGEFPLSVSAP